MRITNISNVQNLKKYSLYSTRPNTAHLNYQKDSFEGSNKVSISFLSNIKTKALRAQATILALESSTALKEANEIREDAYYIKQKAKRVLSESSAILKASKQVLKSAQQTFKAAKASGYKTLISKTTGNVLREFYRDEDNNNAFTMEEYFENGAIKRRVFVSVNELAVELYGKNEGSKTYVYSLKDGSLLRYFKDSRELINGFRAKEFFLFQNNTLTTHDSDYVSYDDGSGKSEERLEFEDGKLMGCFGGCEDKRNGILKNDEEYYFEGDMLKKATRMAQISPDKQTALQEYLYDTEGYVFTCKKNINYISESAQEASCMYIFDDLGLHRTLTDVTLDSKSEKITSKKAFCYEDEKPKGCVFSYEYKSGAEDYGEFVEL